MLRIDHERARRLIRRAEELHGAWRIAADEVARLQALLRDARDELRRHADVIGVPVLLDTPLSPLGTTDPNAFDRRLRAVAEKVARREEEVGRALADREIAADAFAAARRLADSVSAFLEGASDAA